MEESFENTTFAVDFGSERQVHLEFPAANTIWVAAGSGFEVADIWMKEIGGADLRVRITRLGNALEVSIDRGDQSGNWWPPPAAPRLLIALNQIARRASATASLGEGHQIRTVELGSVSY